MDLRKSIYMLYFHIELNLSHSINSTFLGRNMYARGMGMNFHKLLKRHEAVLSGKVIASPPSSRASSATSSPTSEFSRSPFSSKRSSLSSQSSDSDYRLPRHLDPVHGLAVAEAVSAALSLRFPGLDDFDDTFTRIAGGVPQDVPLPSYKEYYGTSSVCLSLYGDFGLMAAGF